MKRLSIFLVMLIIGSVAKAQKVDSIFFHLYTDSLKKGTHNYINVDGKMSDGSWKPLTSKEIEFTSSACKFSGNELVVPMDCGEQKITVKAVLKENPSIWKETTIWIKTIPDPTSLPSQKEILEQYKGKKKRD